MDNENTLPKITQDFKPGQHWHYGGVVSKDEAGTLLDLSTMTARMTFRNADLTNQELLTLTESDGITLLNDEGTHNYEVFISSEHSLLFNHCETVVADLFIIDGLTAHPIFDVTFTINRSKTVWNAT